MAGTNEENDVNDCFLHPEAVSDGVASDCYLHPDDISCPSEAPDFDVCCAATAVPVRVNLQPESRTAANHGYVQLQCLNKTSLNGKIVFLCLVA